MEESVFHSAKQAPAVLKHAVIERYLPVLISKTGSASSGGRVGFVDFYAGPGRYADGTEGSGALALRIGKNAATLGTGRALDCHFVERDAPTRASLIEVVGAERGGLVTTIYDGDAATAIPGIINALRDCPAIFYLDPCGLLVPFKSLMPLLGRLEKSARPTELLLNFSASALRRIAGHLTSEFGLEATLARMDDVCGGGWWRAEWISHLPDKARAEAAVIEMYARRLASIGKSGFWVVPVRKSERLLPVYYLVFLTRHRDGMSHFGEALSMSLVDWRKFLAADREEGSLLGVNGTWADQFAADERLLEEDWITVIAQNLRSLLLVSHVNTVEHYSGIFGSTLGQARQKHLRAAWKLLFDDGVVSNSPRGLDVLRSTIRSSSLP